ncbi:MAG TPA: glycosyltransferase family 39 protein [Candidatus Limnocylindrales bacterium]|nr:glycosyltransferase family 39 protein [Candidatus Limnocylindrales bacterium]
MSGGARAATRTEAAGVPRRLVGAAWPSLAVAGLALLLLVPVLDLDPPRSVTFSDSPFTDEAWYVLNSRNLVLFGRWATDDWTLYLVTPVYAALQALNFSLFGPGILQARALVTAVTVSTAVLLAAGLRPSLGTTAALLAAIALATSALALYYGRLAYAEILVGAALTAATLAAGRASATASFGWGLLAGAALALSAGAKPVALGAAAGLVLGAVVAGGARPAVLRWAFGALLVFALAAAGWLLVVWIPAGAGGGSVLRILTPQALPISVADLAERIAGYVQRNDGAFARSAPLVLGALAALVLAAAGIPRRNSSGSDEAEPDTGRSIAGAAAGWFLLGLAVLLVQDYRPNRYFVPLLPALAILTGIGARAALDAIPAALPRHARLLACLALVGALGLPGIATHVDWIGRGTRMLPGVEARAAKLLPSGSAVEGPYAPAVALAAHSSALVARPDRAINEGDLYLERGVRWVVADSEYVPAWVHRHPEAWAAREAVVCFLWGHSWQQVCLLRVP